MHSHRTNKRRALPAMAMTVASVACLTTRMSANAFMAVDTTTTTSPFSSSSIIARTQSKVKVSTKLFASDNDKKLSIETITDDNRHTLLRPPSSPDRPILVDAFAPWCGPCKLLDKVLRKSQPKYLDKVDFCRWNVNDKDNTVELKKLFLESGYTLTKLPSLIVFREGEPVAIRAGFANEFQLDDFLEKTLPDVLERTFDEDGIKMVQMPAGMMEQKEREEVVPESKKSEEIAASATTSATDKPLPLPEEKMVNKEKEIVQESKAVQGEDKEDPDDCNDEQECFERLEQTIWLNRTVVPAMDGILLPARR